MLHKSCISVHMTFTMSEGTELKIVKMSTTTDLITFDSRCLV